MIRTDATLEVRVVDSCSEDERRHIETFFRDIDKIKEEIERAATEVSCWWSPPRSQSWKDWYEPGYLKSKEWKRIKRRVLKRDSRLCRCCGGEANIAHHRSYTEDVMSGMNDEQLASVCEGCHKFIHFDDAGKARNPEEIDRLLFAGNRRSNFLPTKVDLRQRRGAHPPDWERVSAFDRAAWDREYDRLWFIGKLQRANDPRVTALNRRYLYSYGMEDSAIDAAIALKPRSRSVHKRPPEFA